MLRSFTALILALTALLVGCKAVRDAEARTAGALLTEAGFRVLPADTPERVAALEKLKPRAITIVTKNGKKYWVYPDTTYCGCLLAGTEAQYQEYLRLIGEEQLQEEALRAGEGPTSDWGMSGPWR